jgi:hypothetical protein
LLGELVPAALGSEEARQALRFLKAGDWASLYKALETVAHDAGGEKNTVDRGWATKDEIHRFKGTANNFNAIGAEARHAQRGRETPRRTMSFEEAKRLIGRVIEAWLKSKSNPQAGDQAT